MPGFDHLFTEEQLTDLVAFLYSLRPETLPPWTPEPAIVIGVVVPATTGTIETGHALYLLMGCANCHGVSGNGKGPSARALTDDLGRPMRTTDFRHDPLKGGRTAEAVMRTLRTGLNGAPMPSYDEAMLFAREDFAPATLSEDNREALEIFLATAPTRADLAALDDGGRSELRDERLAALAQYVLSLDQRQGFRFRLFVQEPEREPRKERAGKKDRPPGEEEFWDE
ncbi:MAG: cytochrome c [Acidobacteriota bacterium]|nr:cytochrome c [Acidobacteriota bacterium]